jgi:predicted choloylglycine hydrolase
MYVHLKLVHEPWPGERWQQFFDRAWPLFRLWYESEGLERRPDLATCRSLLELHMPELVPVYNSLCRLAHNDDVAARFLSFWCPPPYMAACSQVAWTKGSPTLIRNYDFDPRYFDGRMRYTAYMKPVIGMQDSGWGLLDGMNIDGLAVSLAFGGRKVSGTGFGIPLVVRYVLETCTTTEEACAVLVRVPVHMGYNVTVLDKSGKYATVYLNPDRPPQVIHQPVATNHQHQVEWDEYAAFTDTVARKHLLEECVAEPKLDRATLIRRFLRPPLYSQHYLRGFGTLYTAAYDVTKGRVQIIWPEKQVEASFKRFEEQEAQVVLLRPVGRYLAK